jgi:hypothetical protein
MLIGRALAAGSHLWGQARLPASATPGLRVAGGRQARCDGNYGQSVRTASERATEVVRAVASRMASMEKTQPHWKHLIPTPACDHRHTSAALSSIGG